MFLEYGAVVVGLFRHGGVLRESECCVLEHEVGDVLVSVVPEGVDPAVAYSVRELKRDREKCRGEEKVRCGNRVH